MDDHETMRPPTQQKPTKRPLLNTMTVTTPLENAMAGMEMGLYSVRAYNDQLFIGDITPSQSELA
eukprot:1022957-Amphidinium_carterae.2